MRRFCGAINNAEWVYIHWTEVVRCTRLISSKIGNTHVLCEVSNETIWPITSRLIFVRLGFSFLCVEQLLLLPSTLNMFRCIQYSLFRFLLLCLFFIVVKANTTYQFCKTIVTVVCFFFGFLFLPLAVLVLISKDKALIANVCRGTLDYNLRIEVSPKLKEARPAYTGFDCLFLTFHLYFLYDAPLPIKLHVPSVVMKEASP